VLGHLDKGKRYLDLAQDIATKSGVAKEVFDTFQVYYVKIQLGNFERVRDDLEREIARYADQKVKLRIIEGYWYLCRCYRHLGLYNEAEVIARSNLNLPYIDMIDRFQGELILLAFVNEDYEAAERIFKQFAYENQLTDLQIESHQITGWVALGRGNLEKAIYSERHRLSHKVKNHYGFQVQAQFAEAALLMAKSGRVERAIELYSVACQLPFVCNSQWFEDVFGRHIEKAAVSLPYDVVEAAKARGRELDIWETAESLLEELNGDMTIFESNQ
jgi:tetratricopeptide (TPR) repeat protein